MSAVLTRNATEVRQNFRQFIDQVLHERPQAVVRHGDDIILAFSLKHLDALLESTRFTLEYEQEADGSCSGCLQQLPICENAASPEELKLAIARSLVEYTDVYLSEFERCFHSPELKKQFSSVMKVYTQPSLEAVVNLIDE